MKRWNRILSILMALALVCTTFGSDLATTRAYAVESDEELELYENRDIKTVEWESVSEESNNESEDAQPEEPEGEATQEEATSEAVEGTSEEAVAEEAVAEEAVAEGDEAGEAIDEANTEEADAATEAISEEAEDELTEDAIDEAAEAEKKKEATEKEKKLVKITYKVTSGGKFADGANQSETVDLLDEEATFKGASVEPINEAFEFVNWTDENGEEVGTGLTFVPKDVTEDAVFTANFKATEKIEKYPAIEKNDVHAGGLVVSIKADDGAFPDGTSVEIRGISDSQALSTAQDELGGDVTAAVGVDITFYYDGSEIQPAADSFVHVSLDIEKTIEGTEFAVLHDHDGSVEQIDASISTQETDDAKVVTDVAFSVNEFSIFIIAAKDVAHEDSADELRVATYEFFSGSTLVSTQVVKDGEDLQDPGIPEMTAQQEFKGWFLEGESEKLVFPYTVALPETVAIGTVIKVNAEFSTSYYVSFRGTDNEVVYVKKAEASIGEGGEEEYASITVDDVTIVVDSSKHQAFVGWTTVKDSRKDLIKDNSLKVDKDMDIYAFVTEAYYIYFNENDGEGGGASYTGPIFAEAGNKPVKPANPTRKGYIFGGWYTSETEFTDETKFDWNKNIDESITVGQDITLYAKWDEAPDTEYTIIVWKQKITDSVTMTDDQKTYDYLTSYVYTASTNAPVSVSGTKSAKVNVGGINVYDSSSEGADKYKGFHYSRNTIADGKGTSTAIVGRKGDTVINIYYDRNELTISFISYKVASESTPGQKYGKFGDSYIKVEKYSSGQWGYYGGMFGGTFYSINIDGDGKLYVEDEVDAFTGLYGQRLADCGYTWPSGEWYEKDDKTHLTFLDAFIFDQLQTDDSDKTHLTLRLHTTVVDPYKVEFFKQSVDGSAWINSTADAQRHEGGWIITEKYSGFKYKEYSINGGKNWYSNVSVNETIHTKHNIQLRYERLKYNLVFMYGDEQVGIESDVYYETPLKKFSASADAIKAEIEKRYESSSSQQFVFEGWYEDKTLTNKIDFSDTTEIMPVDGKTVYAKVEPVRYKVKLYPNGGTLIDGQSEEFNADWGDVISKDSLVATARDGYDLIGWFWYKPVTDEIGDIYIYGSKITSDVNIIAKWRNAGSINVKYTVDAAVGEGVTVPVDGFKYATGSTIRVLARPTAFDESKYSFVGWELVDRDGNSKGIFNPNDFFELTEDLVNAQKKVTLKAVFQEKINRTTTYVYDANFAGGSRTQPETVQVNTAFTVKDFADTGLVAKTSATFKGWSVNKSATEPEILPGAAYVAADENGGADSNVLYAVWTDLFTVTWLDEDETELEKDTDVEAGAMPEYNGAIPTKDEDEDNTYEFDGWTPDIVPVTEDAIYIAKYKAIPKPVVDVAIKAKSSKEGNIYNGESAYIVDGFDWTATDAEGNVITVTDEDLTVKLTTASADKAHLEEKDAGTYDTDLAVSDFEVKTTKYKLRNVTVENGELVIDKLPITINITGHKSPEEGKENIYNGSIYTAEGYDVTFEPATSAKQLADGSVTSLELSAEKVEALHGSGADSIKFTGDAKVSQSAAGTYSMGLAVGQFSSLKDKNFIVTFKVVDGELVIKSRGDNAYILDITADDVVRVYNGTNQSVSLIPGVTPEETQPVIIGRLIDPVRGFFTIVASAADGEAEFEIDGNKYVAKNIRVSASGTDVSNYNFTFDNPVQIYQGEKEVTENFKINSKLGRLIINPAPLQVTTDSARRLYNGDALTAGGSLTGLVNGERATLVTTGSQTGVGSSPNTYRIEWITAKASNYSISESIGTLEVYDEPITNPDPPIIIPDDPTPITPTPVIVPEAAVLGARRDLENGQAVLGARRGRTEDDSNIAVRILVILIAAIGAILLAFTGRKKEKTTEQ